MMQLAIFDLDGTLVDSVEDLANAANHALTQLEYPTHPVDAYYHFVGNGVPKLCARALPADAAPETLEKMLRLFNAYYLVHCLDCTKPYVGIYPALEKLHDAGIRLAVASNKTQDFVRKIVTQLFGERQFDCILGGNPNRPKKPSPEIIEEILGCFQVAPVDAVMIGDSDVDIRTAQNAGIASIGCTWGFRGKEELQRAGAERLAEKPADLVQLLLPE